MVHGEEPAVAVDGHELVVIGGDAGDPARQAAGQRQCAPTALGGGLFHVDRAVTGCEGPAAVEGLRGGAEVDLAGQRDGGSREAVESGGGVVGAEFRRADRADQVAADRRVRGDGAQGEAGQDEPGHRGESAAWSGSASTTNREFRK